MSDFEKLMGLIGAKTQNEYDIFVNEKGMLKDIMSIADEFRDDSEMIEMFDRETEINRIKELEKKDALIKNTEEVTNKVTVENTKKIAINLINNGIDLETISNSTGLSIDELNKLKEELS